MNIFETLTNKAENSFIQIDYGYKAAALVISQNKEFYGVNIMCNNPELNSSALVNAICSSVSSGYTSIDEVFYYLDKPKITDSCFTEFDTALLSEFHIGRILCYDQNKKEYPIIYNERTNTIIFEE